MDYPNPVSYLAAFASEQSIVVSWHFVSTDGTVPLWLWPAVRLCLDLLSWRMTFFIKSNVHYVTSSCYWGWPTWHKIWYNTLSKSAMKQIDNWYRFLSMHCKMPAVSRKRSAMPLTCECVIYCCLLLRCWEHKEQYRIIRLLQTVPYHSAWYHWL